jgi:tyrosine-specific transport protein
VRDDGPGSVLGASLLFAGTAIGAGALALPRETYDAGFAPSIFGLLSCWAYTYVTSMATLEASWLSMVVTSRDDEGNGVGVVDGNDAGSFLSISRMSLGRPGEIVTASIFWFLLTALIVAYTSEGGVLISRYAMEISSSHAEDISMYMHPSFGSLLFASSFAILIVRGGTRGVDFVNRAFVFGLVASFVGLVISALPHVVVSNLTYRANWDVVYPNVISIGILSLGAQNVVPTMLRYLNHDPLRTKRAILIGSMMPLILYAVWEGISMGVIDASNESTSELLGRGVGGDGDGAFESDYLVGVFSFCAIGSSMAGASVSLIDFFRDGMNNNMKLIEGGRSSSSSSLSSSSSSSSSSSPSLFVNEDDTMTSAGILKSRTLAAVLALGPPVFLAYAFPNLFLVALEEAGLLGAVSLYGIIPAISILSLRRKKDNTSSSSVEEGITNERRAVLMPGRLGGGDLSMIALVLLSLALVLPAIRKMLL